MKTTIAALALALAMTASANSANAFFSLNPSSQYEAPEWTQFKANLFGGPQDGAESDSPDGAD